jgi:hypothetical protein
MEKTFDVVIVSAQGRENWMALELMRQGKKVAVLDYSPKMSLWAPEDLEGPFGVFQSRQNQPSQMARLADEEPLLNQDVGWVVWPKSGPVEMTGPLSKFQLDSLKQNESVLEYVRIADTKSDEEKSRLKSLMEHLPFNQTWLAELSHQLASTIYAENREGHLFSTPLPLFAPFFIRRLTRRGIANGRVRLLESGVVILDNPGDIRFDINEGKIQLAVCGDHPIKAKNWIWLLSTAETQFALPVAFGQVFPHGLLKPEWQWMRYRIKTEVSPQVAQLPDNFVLLEDVFLSWTHENLAIFQRTNRPDDFDFWIRVPSTQRFNKEYIEKKGELVIDQFRRRLPKLVAHISDWPQETIYKETELGPSLYPVFDSQQRRKFKTSNFSGFHFGGPEFWNSLNWGGRFRHHEKILAKLQAQEIELKIKKGEIQSDREIHPI